MGLGGGLHPLAPEWVPRLALPPAAAAADAASAADAAAAAPLCTPPGAAPQGARPGAAPTFVAPDEPAPQRVDSSGAPAAPHPPSTSGRAVPIACRPAACPFASARAAVAQVKALFDAGAPRPASQAALGALSEATAAALRSVSGSIPDLVQELGGEFTGPHLDPGRLQSTFGSVPGVDRLCEVAAHGVTPPILDEPADLAAHLRTENSASAGLFEADVFARVLQDAALGRVLVLPRGAAFELPRCRIAPLIAVKQKDKVRIVADYSREHRRADGTFEPSVNSLTDRSRIPPTDIGDVFSSFLAAAYRLRLRYPHAHLVFRKIDVADAFRQLRIHPSYAPLFAYAVGDWLVVDLRLTFGWAGSPGFFLRVAEGDDPAHHLHAALRHDPGAGERAGRVDQTAARFARIAGTSAHPA